VDLAALAEAIRNSLLADNSRPSAHDYVGGAPSVVCPDCQDADIRVDAPTIWRCSVDRPPADVPGGTRRARQAKYTAQSPIIVSHPMSRFGHNAFLRNAHHYGFAVLIASATLTPLLAHNSPFTSCSP